MTDNERTERVEVTQADREAAEYYAAATDYSPEDNDPAGDLLRIAFARHREQAYAEGRRAAIHEAEDAGLAAERWANTNTEFHPMWRNGYEEGAKSIAAAIRALT